MENSPEALKKAHEALLDDLQGLERALHSPGGEDSAAISARLGRTQAHITQHFRFEEANGYMSAVLKKKPHLERVAGQLLGDHLQLAQTLSRLVDEAKTATKLDARFSTRVRAWIEDVRQHESRENQLVQEAFNVDMDAED